jgi:hypothetical protein
VLGRGGDTALHPGPNDRLDQLMDGEQHRQRGEGELAGASDLAKRQDPDRH